MAERRRRSRPASEETLSRVQQWTQRIERARKVRARWKKRYHVDLLAETFSGVVGELVVGAIPFESDDGPTDINRFWSTVKAAKPGLLAQHPTFFVREKARQGAREPRQAMFLEAILQQLAVQDDHLSRAAKLALHQAFFGLGVLKVLYDATTEPNPEAGRPLVVRDEQGVPIRNVLTGEPIHVQDGQGRMARQPDRIATDETYRWQWVNGHNMLLPDEGPDRLRWTWIGEEIVVPLEEAQEDERFPKSLRDQLQATRRPPAEGVQQILSDIASEAGYEDHVYYIECWDIRKQRYYVHAPGQSFSATAFLLDADVPDGVEDHPYALLIFQPETDPEPQAWPIPHVWPWLAVHRAYQHHFVQVTEGGRRSARKIYYDDNTFPDADEARDALRSSLDMQAVKVTDTSRPPVTIADPGSTPDLIRALSVANEEWQFVTGLTGARLAAPASDTATEALLTERASNMRDVELRLLVDQWLAEAGRKMAQRVQATLTLGMALKIRGFDDQEFQEWLKRTYPGAAQLSQFFPGLKQLYKERFGGTEIFEVSREDITFEAEIGVEPGSARPRTLDAERQQFLVLLRILAGAPQLMASRELLRMLGELFEFRREGLLDELHLLGRQMLQAQTAPRGTARPAGAGNGATAAAGGTPGGGAMGALMQAMTRAG